MLARGRTMSDHGFYQKDHKGPLILMYYFYLRNIHSHPKKYGFGFWVWVWVYTQNPYPKNPKNLGKTQNPYPKTQFLGFSPKTHTQKPKKIWVWVKTQIFVIFFKSFDQKICVFTQTF